MTSKRAAGAWAFGVGLAIAATWGAGADPAPPEASTPAARVRHPVAAAFLDDGHTLCVANRRSGTLSLVDVSRELVRDELAVGKRLADLAVLPDRKHVLTVDEEHHELVALSFEDGRLSVRARLAVGPYPVSVAVLADGTRATVASLWSRRLEVIDLAPLTSSTGTGKLRIVHTLRLPFAPRGQCVLPGGAQVVVADSFAGHLAVVDANSGRLVARHTLNGHNLRGLALGGDGKQLLVAHQLLDQQAPATRDNLTRGLLMANVVRSIPLQQLIDPHGRLEEGGKLIRLGDVSAGAGDPAGLAVLDAERFAVALAGVNEVAVVRGEDGKRARRTAVGRRPTVLLRGPEGTLVVVNTFDDSLSLLDGPGRVTRTISLGAQGELSPADRGELLFYDAHLARDGWLSCHSCHTDGHTNSLLADTLGDNTYGTPKRTLTLGGTALTDPWAWNGEMKYLQDQIDKSLRETMHAPSVRGEQVNALLAFLHTLPPPPPLSPPTDDEADRAQVERGRQVFERHGCANCHIPPLTYSSHGTYDVGFADERGLRTFNPPSLRGVGQGYSFLHDSRAATLEELFTKYHHKVETDLPEEDLSDLLRFLRSL